MAELELTTLGMDIGLSHFGEDEQATYLQSGYGRTLQPGHTPAIIAVDFTYEFCGRRSPNTGESGAATPKGAGPVAWDAIDKARNLFSTARRVGVPIIYTRNETRTHPVEIGNWGRKTSNQSKLADLEIVSEIAPQKVDLVIRKTKPSAFFGTPLASWLVEIGADTVFIAGGTTSGCVRATVTDAFSTNLRTFVLTDAVFDRSRTSHEVNLFEMQQKYAGLTTTEATSRWIDQT